MRKIKKIFLFILILLISIGFAVLTTNLNLGSTLSFRQNTFDIHLENPSIKESTTSMNSSTSLTNTTTLSFSTTYTKPGEAVDVLFYIVNDGTIDASVNSITTTLSSTEQKYITYRFNYASDNSLVSKDDIIYSGQARGVIAHFEYKYDIEELIDLDNFSTTINIQFVQAQSTNNNVWKYEYVGDYQTFTAPKTGLYKIELWGASGSGTSEPSKGESLGGKGAYTSGKINLNKNQKLYIYVGQGGSDITLSNFSNLALYTARFNGGGAGAFDTNESGTAGEHGFAGGGATDVRLVSGNWDDFTSLKSRIMVAGAGGGGGWSGNGSQDQYYVGGGGYAGGLSAPSAPNKATTLGGTQTSGNKFGIGGNAAFDDGYNNNAMSAGGGGYFGGYKGVTFAKQNSSGAGGSSYISGHNGCVAIEGTSVENNITFPTKNGVACTDGTTNQECSVHYSGKEFTDTIMIDGKGYQWTTEVGNTIVGMPTHDGLGTMTGNTGDGFAKITLEDSILCKRATTLHTTTCKNYTNDYTKMCTRSPASYSVNDPIVYGNIPNSKNYKNGDAFDCDVNGDGNYDATNERFYYVTDLESNSNYAVLIYSFTTVGGVNMLSGNINKIYNTSNNAYKGPDNLINELPSTSQWPNVRLYNYRRQLYSETGSLLSGSYALSFFKYTNFTSRLLTYQEAYRACSNTTSWNKACEYLFENTSYDNYNNYTSNWGIWLENPYSGSNANACRLDSHLLSMGCGYPATNTNLAAKPVIEVPKNRME